MALRGFLHVNHLPAFKTFLIGEGYEIEPTKGNYEVLRARRNSEPPLIFFERGTRGGSITVQDVGNGWPMARKFMNIRRKKKQKKGPDGKFLEKVG